MLHLASKCHPVGGTNGACGAQACGCEYSVTEEEVEEGEVDKLMQRVLRLASEVRSHKCSKYAGAR